MTIDYRCERWLSEKPFDNPHLSVQFEGPADLAAQVVATLQECPHCGGRMVEWDHERAAITEAIVTGGGND